MPLQPGDINKSILEVFNSMKEGVSYTLTDKAFQEFNQIRKKYGYDEVKPFSFQKIGKELVFNWEANKWNENRVLMDDLGGLAFALARSFPFTSALPFAFAENQIQEKQVTCDGKIVEIEGVKYKLVLQ